MEPKTKMPLRLSDGRVWWTDAATYAYIMSIVEHMKETQSTEIHDQENPSSRPLSIL